MAVLNFSVKQWQPNLILRLTISSFSSPASILVLMGLRWAKVYSAPSNCLFGNLLKDGRYENVKAAAWVGRLSKK